MVANIEYTYFVKVYYTQNKYKKIHVPPSVKYIPQGNNP